MLGRGQEQVNAEWVSGFALFVLGSGLVAGLFRLSGREANADAGGHAP